MRPGVRNWLWAGACVALALAVVLIVASPAGLPHANVAVPAVFGVVFAVFAAWIVVSDLRSFEIPDEANVGLFVTGLLWSTLGPLTIPVEFALVYFVYSDLPSWLVYPLGYLAVLLDALARAAIAAGALLGVRVLYRALRGIDGLGLGDVKLAGAAAPWLSWSDLPMALLLAVVAALVATIAAAVVGRKGLDRAAWIPLGAFLAPAAFAVWLLRLAGLPIGFGG